MNMYANKYNNLQFFTKNLGYEFVVNSYITTNTSLIAHQSKYISLQKILFHTQKLVIHQQMGHKSYPIIIYLGQICFVA